METTPKIRYTDPSPPEEAKKLRNALAWVHDSRYRDVTHATDGTPLYCGEHAHYVGFRGVFPCPECA